MIRFALFLCAFAPAAWAVQDEEYRTVKIVSEDTFHPGHPYEGSGYFLSSSTVITVEHVVSPCDNAKVTVIDYAGKKYPAKVTERSFENGLAILELDHGTNDYLPEISDQFYDASQEEAGAFGYAYGSSQVRSVKGRVSADVVKRKIVPRGEAGIVRGMGSEFGMSGGPVFARGFMGLLTSRSYGASDETYFVPVKKIRDWLNNQAGDLGFRRKCGEDGVLQGPSNVDLELSRTPKGDILASFSLRHWFSDFPFDKGTYGYMALVYAMDRSHLRYATLRNFNGATFEEAVSYLVEPGAWLEVDDYEKENGNSRYPYLNDFSAHQGANAEYAVEGNDGLTWVKLEEELGWSSVNFRVSTEFFTGGNYASQNYYDNYDDDKLASRDWWRTTEANCEANGGHWEKIVVPAGTFEACRKEEKDGTAWYGPVPVFGLVQWKLKDGSETWKLARYVL